MGAAMAEKVVGNGNGNGGAAMGVTVVVMVQRWRRSNGGTAMVEAAQHFSFRSITNNY
jgi:hypothetical protein